MLCLIVFCGTVVVLYCDCVAMCSLVLYSVETVLPFVVLCCVVLRCDVLYCDCVALCCVVFYSVVTILFSVVLYGIALYSFVL